MFDCYEEKEESQDKILGAKAGYAQSLWLYGMVILDESPAEVGF